MIQQSKLDIWVHHLLLLLLLHDPPTEVEHLDPSPALAGHLAAPTELLHDPPKEVGHLDSPPALAEHLDPPPALARHLAAPSEQSLIDPPGEAGHGGHLDPLAGLAGDGVNISWKACMDPCEGTCSSVPSFCSAWSHWYPWQSLSYLLCKADKFFLQASKVF